MGCPQGQDNQHVTQHEGTWHLKTESKYKGENCQSIGLQVECGPLGRVVAAVVAVSDRRLGGGPR